MPDDIEQNGALKATDEEMLSDEQRRILEVQKDVNDAISDQTKFQEFNPKQYLEQFYPAIENVEAVGLFDKLRELKGNQFNVGEIANEYGITPEIVENLFLLNFQMETAKEALKNFTIGRFEVLDIGGGPTVYQHVLPALLAHKTIDIEYTEQNRDEVMQFLRSNWLLDWERRNLGGANGRGIPKPESPDNIDYYNWDSYIELIHQAIKNDDQLVELIKGQEFHSPFYVQRAIKGIEGNLTDFKAACFPRPFFMTHGDIFNQENILKNESGEIYYDTGVDYKDWQVELVISNFTVESATSDRSKWEIGMQNIMDRVKPGGLLSLSAIRNSEWYPAGNEKMPATPINEEDLRRILLESGFQIVKEQVLLGSDKNQDGYDGMIFVLAKKNEDSTDVQIEESQ